MSRIAIIGGGISGLSAAHYLSKSVTSSFPKIVVYEGSTRLGGWMKTSKLEDGTIFEHGPRSIRGVGRAGINSLELVEELGLEDQLLPVPASSPAARNRYIYANKKLCPLPNSLGSVLKRQEPFSKPLVLHGWKEPIRKAPKQHDDTVHNFFSRRLGEEVAKYMGSAICRGIFAGDSTQLSMKSCFPLQWEWEQKYGSLFIGAFRHPKDNYNPNSPLVTKYKLEKWAMWSLKDGLQSLAEQFGDNLRQRDNVDIRTATMIDGVSFDNGKVKIKVGSKEEEFDHVFCTTLGKDFAPLLPGEHSDLSTQLTDIPAVDCAVVNLQYKGNVMPIEGFGHLVPSCEPEKVLGVLYESCVFKEHNGRDNSTRITCMMGGAWFKEYFGEAATADRSIIEELAVKAVRDHLGIQGAPFRTIVNVHKDCIPQYTVGHSDRVQSIDDYISSKALPLTLVGATYRGVSINDCIYKTRLVVEQFVKDLEGK